MEQGRDPWGCHIQMGKSTEQSTLDKHHQKWETLSQTQKLKNISETPHLN